GLDRAVIAVAHPAIELVMFRRHGEKITKAHALHKALDVHNHGRDVVAHLPSPRVCSLRSRRLTLTAAHECAACWAAALSIWALPPLSSSRGGAHFLLQSAQ